MGVLNSQITTIFRRPEGRYVYVLGQRPGAAGSAAKVGSLGGSDAGARGGAGYVDGGTTSGFEGRRDGTGGAGISESSRDGERGHGGMYTASGGDGAGTGGDPLGLGGYINRSYRSYRSGRRGGRWGRQVDAGRR